MRLTQNGEAVDLDIILVHGTWGRGIFPSSRPSPKSVAKPRWFQPHSRFRASLEKALSDAPESLMYSVSTFEWSGANSFIERSEAAKSLAARLDAESSSHPHKKHILIGHSHGGSVCMLACVHVKTARPNIVTLATPFIELDASGINTASPLRRALAEQWRQYSLGGFCLIWGTFVWSLVAALVLHWTNPTFVVQPLEFPFTTAFLGLPYEWLRHTWMPVILSLPIGIFGIDTATKWSRNALHTDWAVGGLMQRYKSTSILVLRGVDDEATMALTLGAIGNRLTEPLAKLSILFFLGVLATMVGAWLWSEPLFQSAFAHRLYRVAIAALCSAWLIELLAGCCKAVYGREMAIWSLGLQIRSHSSPDHAGRLSIITLPYGGGRGLLRHAMYDHESTAAAIRLWVQQGFMLWPVEDEAAEPPRDLKDSTDDPCQT